jgi:hypothetical protein
MIWSAVVRASAVLVALLIGSAAQATPFQFAGFHLINASQPLSFTNNGGTSGTLSALSVPVVFNFTTQSGLPTTDRNATLTINPVGTNPTVTPAIFPGSLVDQPINPLTFSIIENGTGKNLLSMQATSADLIGLVGSFNGSISATKTNIFTSDYTAFTPSATESFNLGLGTLSQPLAAGAGGFLSNFLANVNGQFSTDSLVPEPASVALLGIGVLSVTVVTALKRLRKGTSGNHCPRRRRRLRTIARD